VRGQHSGRRITACPARILPLDEGDGPAELGGSGWDQVVRQAWPGEGDAAGRESGALFLPHAYPVPLCARGPKLGDLLALGGKRALRSTGGIVTL